VRVRISDGTATITLKGPRTGIRCDEFEYEIPLADAERMVDAICNKDVLEKRRYFVEASHAIWHVDVYTGALEGVVVAEIELRQENEALALPSWAGREVTGDLRYRKFNLLALHARRQPESDWRPAAHLFMPHIYYNVSQPDNGRAALGAIVPAPLALTRPAGSNSSPRA
jgi:adenylate cyclase